MQKLLVGLGIALLLTVNCKVLEKDDSEIDKNDLIGTWYSTETEMKVIITTNVDQTVFDINSEGIGAITITGELNAELKYISAFFDEILVSSQNYFTGEVYEVVSLVLEENYATLTVMDSSVADYIYFEAENPDYSFDEDTRSLTVNPLTMYKYDMQTWEIDSAATIQVSGELRSPTINIKTNEPEEIEFFAFFEGVSDQTIFEIKENGTWTMNYMGGDVPETGTWTINDDKFVIQEDSLMTEMDYELKNGILILKMQNDFCDNQYDGNGCYQMFEELMGFDEGAIDNIEMIMALHFSEDGFPELEKQGPIFNKLDIHPKYRFKGLKIFR